jgi:hypothetical protein
MSNVLEQAVNSSDGDQAAKIEQIRQAEDDPKARDRCRRV